MIAMKGMTLHSGDEKSIEDNSMIASVSLDRVNSRKYIQSKKSKQSKKAKYD